MRVGQPEPVIATEERPELENRPPSWFPQRHGLKTIIVGKRCLILIFALMIAWQSVASSVDEGRLHHADLHEHEHSQGLADSDSKDSAAEPSSDTPQHSSDHCHHSHNCFHHLVTGNLMEVSGLIAGVTLSDYLATFTAGVRTSPFRPPII